METTIKQRFNMLVESEKINQISFARKVGLNKGTVNNYFKKETKPDFVTIQKIALAFKKLNLRWFITGEGEIYEGYGQMTSQLSLMNEQHATYIHPELERLYKEREEMKDEIIQLQREVIKCKDKGKQAC